MVTRGPIATWRVLNPPTVAMHLVEPGMHERFGAGFRGTVVLARTSSSIGRIYLEEGVANVYRYAITPRAALAWRLLSSAKFERQESYVRNMLDRLPDLDRDRGHDDAIDRLPPFAFPLTLRAAFAWRLRGPIHAGIVCWRCGCDVREDAGPYCDEDCRRAHQLETQVLVGPLEEMLR